MVFEYAHEGTPFHDTGIPTPVEEFQYFVDGLDEVIEEANTLDYRPDGLFSLFDIIELWLIAGNGFEQCPTYSSFLVACIAITDWTSRQGPKTNEWGERRAWRGRDLPTFQGDRYSPDAFTSPRLHPLLFEEHYESLKARKAAAELARLHVKLDALLGHFKIAPKQEP